MYRLELLGGLTLHGPSGPVVGRAARPRQLAVLARIAAASTGFVGRDKLAACFWSDRPDEQARHLLADILYLLRRELGDGVIVSSGDNVGLNPDALITDLGRFEQALDTGALERAVTLYAGPFLDGFSSPNGRDFDKWVDTQRRRLAQRYSEALELLAETAEDAGRPLKAVTWWEMRAEVDPFDSRVACRLMSAHAESGNLAKALQYARYHEDLLRTELGFEPAPEFRTFVADLGRRDPVAGETVGGAGPDRARRGEAGPIGRDVSSPRASPRATAGPASARGRGIRGPSPRSRGWRRIQLSTATLGVVGIAAVAYFASRGSTQGTGTQRVSFDLASSGEPAIAVLPFGHVGSAPADSAFLNGFQRRVIAQLSKISAVRVIHGMSVVDYLENRPQGGKIGADLGVDYLVEGTVYRESGDLQVSVQLSDAREERVLWSRDFDPAGTAASLFELHRELAEWITREIGAQLLPAEAARLAEHPSDDLEAWNYFEQGLDYAPRSGPDQRGHAILMFQRAIARDPEFALALAHLSMVHSDVFGWGDDRSPARLEESRWTADSALALAPDLAEARIAWGLYQYGGRRDYREADRWMTRALDVSPGHATALSLRASIRRRLGDFDSSIRSREEALLRDPRNRDIAMELVWDYTHAHRYDEAGTTLDWLHSIAPDLGTEVPQKRAWLDLLRTGDAERMRAALQPVFDRADRDGPRSLGNLLYYCHPARISQGAIVRMLDESDRRAIYAAEPETNEIRRNRQPALRHWARAQLADLDQDERQRALYLDSARLVLGERIARTHSLEGDAPGVRRGLLQDYRTLALVLAELGERDAAIAAADTAIRLAEAEEVAFRERPMAMATLAQVHTRLGDLDEAVRLLEGVVPRPSWFSAALLQADPIWAPLEGHTGFEALLETVRVR